MLRGLRSSWWLQRLPAALIPRNAAQPADLVVLNAKILTVDERFREAQALAVRDGRLSPWIDRRGAHSHRRRDTRIDGGGRTVIPGLIDPHARPRRCRGRGVAAVSEPAIDWSCRTGFGPRHGGFRGTHGYGRPGLSAAPARAPLPPVRSWTRRRRTIRSRSMARTRSRSTAWRCGLRA